MTLKTLFLLPCLLLASCQTFAPAPTTAQRAAEAECLQDIAQKGVEQ